MERFSIVIWPVSFVKDIIIAWNTSFGTNFDSSLCGKQGLEKNDIKTLHIRNTKASYIDLVLTRIYT